ncbi:MAG TPA: TolC family protein [Terriglobales bacterium]|jgi:outer membrane protein|nr:TolC family protein [Terriglobales bacterium]
MRNVLIAVTVLLLPVCGFGQASMNVPTAQSLPAAPAPQQIPGQTAPGMAPNGPAPANPQANSAAAATSLSLKQAEALAIKNNPQISVARLMALASEQVTREVRSNLWPTATANLTGVDSRENSRITAGGLNNPIIYERAAAGVMVNQLITDFGRTTNLAASASYAAKAENQNAIATREQILLAVDQAFYSALQSQAVLTVAQQTVNARQTVSDQVDALFKSKLRSQLDLSFANVNLAEAKLLLLDAENNENASLATLSAVLGYPGLHNFQLIEDTTPIASPPGNVDDLIASAFAMRPEILALDFQYQSAQKFQSAEHDLFYPTIEAVGVVGDTPVRNPVLSNWYGAVGVNVGIPLFNGFLYNARAREARLKTQATQDRMLDLRNRISRDVRTSWLNANTAYQRVSVTQQLLDQASLALDLAQTRYSLGLSSIVELSQAQLQQTQAQISSTQAGYDYRLALAILRYQTTGI